MLALPTITLFGQNYTPKLVRFLAGQLCLFLECEDRTHERVGVFIEGDTPDLPVGASLKEAELAIKIYGEFAGIDEKLINADIVRTDLHFSDCLPRTYLHCSPALPGTYLRDSPENPSCTPSTSPLGGVPLHAQRDGRHTPRREAR